MIAFHKVLGLAGLGALLLAAPAAADPGDLAATQDRYGVIQTGAKHLQRALEILDKGEDKFNGHRTAAVKFVKQALTELDDAVKYADRYNKKANPKGKAFFEPDRGKLASTQAKYPAIRNGANQVLDAGKALNNTADKFGNHRFKAMKALNDALDELERAVKDGK